MGGKAFSQPKGNQPALRTPRMNLEVYTRVRDVAIQQLQELFEVVISPAEAPQKPDYGDVDILVEGPKRDFTWEDVALIMSARRAAHNGDTHSFAVQIDDAADAYAQVDVHVCSSGFIKWQGLLDAYGDLMQIMGRFLRPLGLTATSNGLHVRIAEIEQWNRKTSMLFLTHSLEDALDFLGLDTQQYLKGFESLEALFAWIACGRFFHADAFKVHPETTNDRQRLKKRPMFSEFNDEWMLRNAHRWEGRQPSVREDVLREALDYFGKQQAYEEKVASWNAKIEEDSLWSDIAAIVSAEGQRDVNIVIRGLKRWVYFDDDFRPSVRKEAEMDTLQQPSWRSHMKQGDGDAGISKGCLLDWVRKYWRDVKALEKGRVSALKPSRS